MLSSGATTVAKTKTNTIKQNKQNKQNKREQETYQNKNVVLWSDNCGKNKNKHNQTKQTQQTKQKRTGNLPEQKGCPLERQLWQKQKLFRLVKF